MKDGWRDRLIAGEVYEVLDVDSQRGVDWIKITDSAGVTAFFYASRFEKVDTTEELIDEIADAIEAADAAIREEAACPDCAISIRNPLGETCKACSQPEEVAILGDLATAAPSGSNLLQPYPDNNPKSVVGASKVPLWLLPFPALIEMAKAFADGVKKYNPFNWRKTPVAASVYISAIQRHLGAWTDGEDLASDSGVSHLAHIMAGCAILLDAEKAGTLVDDRPKLGAVPEMLNEYAESNK